MVPNEHKTLIVKETTVATSTSSTGSSDSGSKIEEKSEPTISNRRDIGELLGNKRVLLPIKKGEKRPFLPEWQKFDLTVMLDPEYQKLLDSEGNLAVLLGKPSGGLCTIDIDTDEAVEPFLELNPRLRETLQTKGSRGVQIWIQMEGEYPKHANLKTHSGAHWGEWRADGDQSVICGIHPNGNPYQILVKKKPISLSIKEIKWPNDVSGPGINDADEKLVEEAGEPLILSKSGSVSINQMYVVKKFMREHGVGYDSELGQFFLYDKERGRWNKVTEGTLKKRFNEEIGKLAKETDRAELKQKRDHKLSEGLVKLLQSEAEITTVEPISETVIHANNGMICFEQDGVVLKTFHPDYQSRNSCPYNYNEEAICPRFLNELLGSALPEDDILLLQKWCGAALTGRNPAQRFLILKGTAGGGKSTLMNIIEEITGPCNVAQLKTGRLNHPFELASFIGKTLLTGKDVTPEFLRAEGAETIKALTGGDRLDAELKGKNGRIQINGHYNIAITCNTDLTLRLQGDVEAWKRRLLVIDFSNPPPAKRQHDFAKILLKEEGEGILKWMVQGALLLQQDLNEAGDYVLSDDQHEGIDRILEQSESVEIFVKECIYSFAGEDVTYSEVRTAYHDYCDSKGWISTSSNEFNRLFKNAVLKHYKQTPRQDINRCGKDQRGFKNIAINREAMKNA